MNNFDHLIRCETQEEAEALVEQYGSHSAYQLRVILHDAAWDESDPENPVLVTPEVTASGHHVWIALDHLSEELRDLPDNSCRLIGDWSKNSPDAFIEDVIVYHAPDIPHEVLISARCDSEPAGRNYPWRRPRQKGDS